MHGEGAVLIAGIGGVLGDIIQGDAIHQAAAAVGKHDGGMLSIDAEVGMGHAGRAVVDVLAGAIHDIVAVGGHHRALGESPLQRLVLIVGQGIIRQGDGLAGGVVQLNPVRQLAVFIPVTAQRVGADFGDDQRTVGDHRGIAETQEALGVVFIAGAELLRQSPGAVRPAGVALVGGHDGRLHRVDHISVGIIEGNGFAIGGQAELGMQSLACSGLVLLVTVDDQALACIQGHLGEEEADGELVVRQADAFQVDVIGAAVPDFDPVGILAVLIRQGGAVGGHDLADHQTVIDAAGHTLHVHLIVIRADGIVGMAHRGLGADEDQQHDQGSKDRHGHGIANHADFLAAFDRSGLFNRLGRDLRAAAAGSLRILHNNILSVKAEKSVSGGAVTYITNDTRPLLHCTTK